MILDLYALGASGAPSEETIVSLAIRLGQYQGRLMGASQIAAVTTLPRTSVVRHLAAIQRRGNVGQMREGRRVVYFFEKSSSEDDVFFQLAEKVVRQALRELSILDTSIVDTDPDGM